MTLFSGDDEAALDGVSHAFTKALVNKLMLEAMPEPAMKAWLYAAARNAVVDIKRREARISRFPWENGDHGFADPRPDDPLGKAIAELLIEKLPEPLRVQVELKYYGGMNATEIGEAMKVPAATVRTRLRAALRQLREKN
jgi:RNA polymerase sigma-70 factor (ECF subfamily)